MPACHHRLEWPAEMICLATNFCTWRWRGNELTQQPGQDFTQSCLDCNLLSHRDAQGRQSSPSPLQIARMNLCKADCQVCTDRNKKASMDLQATCVDNNDTQTHEHVARMSFHGLLTCENDGQDILKPSLRHTSSLTCLMVL